MRGLRGEGMGAELSLSIWCVCVPVYRRWIIRMSPFPTNRWEESSGRTRTCSANSTPTSPGQPLYFYVHSAFNESSYIPQISVRPLAPPSDWNPSPASLPFGLTGSIIPVPDHSSLHVPLLHPWKTPPQADSQVWWASYFTFIKSIKIILNENP